MSYFGALINTPLMVWFHLISGTSLTGEWSQSNVAILVFKTLLRQNDVISEMHVNGGRTHANYCSLIHYNTPLAEMHPSRRDVLWLRMSAQIRSYKDGAEEAVGNGPATRFPALQSSSGSKIKMEWIADDKSRQPDLVVLWLLTGVNQDWVVLQHLSMPSVNSYKGPLSPTSSDCRCRTQFCCRCALCFTG